MLLTNRNSTRNGRFEGGFILVDQCEHAACRAVETELVAVMMVSPEILSLNNTGRSRHSNDSRHVR